jgi:uncharacterized protein
MLGLPRIVRLVAALALAFPILCRAEASATAPATQPAKMFMWKVTGKSGGTAYLVGSMHLALPGIYPLPKPMEDAFAQADTLAVEVDITKMDQAAMLKKITESGMYAADDSLKKHISPDTEKMLAAFCKDLGLPETGFERMKPWVLFMTIEVLACQKQGLDPANGIDIHFLNAAGKKKVQELESADFQINLLASFPDDVQEKELAEALRQNAKMPEIMKKLEAAWASGDEKSMQEVMQGDSKDDPALKDVEKKLIDDRNGPMAEKIVDDLKGGHITYVVVGAGHLVGDHGVVQLLRGQGYTVTQATNK